MESAAFSRTELLIGSDSFQQLQQSHLLVVGLGGVGGYACEMLVRSGIGEITIVDADTVQESNLNRQIIALRNTIGVEKTKLWQERLLAINPELKLHLHHTFIHDEVTEELLDQGHYHFVIDAIDTLSPKVHLIKSLQERGIPFVSVMGAGAKVDPTRLKIGRMDKVRNCTLAKAIRKRLRRLGVSLKFPVVYSDELPIESAVELVEDEQNKKSITGTIAYLPAVAGCYAAYVAIETLTHPTEKP